jgi:phenylalanyl-tRNA synthetase beta chain
MNNGMKPLNNILDKLNYITLLTNVPTAAYDINDNININVTSAKNGESFTGFDNKTYELNKNDIVVKNNNEIICLAGILGDKKHGINNDTKKLYIEMANFNFVNIRNTSSKYNIKTDSARRNSKLNNNFLVLTAASLLQTMFANNNLKYSLNIKEQPVKTIKFNAKKINELLGTNFTKTEIISHLELLGFNIEDNKIIPPAYRNDVSTNPDLAEEVIKTIDVNDIEAQPIDTSGMTENKYTEYYFINRF